MSFGRFVSLGLVAPALMLTAPAAHAGVGDLLVAPTRVVLNGSRGTEVILNNIGDDVATYRVSAELRRMTPEGKLVEVELPNDKEKAAQEMVLYAPRKVTLPPNQPQAIRLSARAPAGLPDGEYRVHMLFRAIPPPPPVAAPKEGRRRLVPASADLRGHNPGHRPPRQSRGEGSAQPMSGRSPMAESRRSPSISAATAAGRPSAKSACSRPASKSRSRWRPVSPSIPRSDSGR